MTYDIVLLTEKKYLSPQQTDWYIDQVLLEDRLVTAALERKGLSVTRKDWADPNFDWSCAKALLFRATWDYFHRFDEFYEWLERVNKVTHLINPFEQIKWNIDKHYLLDLKKQGVNIVESVFIKRGTPLNLAERLQKLGWKKAVIKPTVSGAARHTYLVNEENSTEHEQLVAPLLKHEDFILQPFIASITEHGEVSHIVFNGTYSHSILKLAKKGDFRVQDDFGGTLALYAASKEEIAFAERVAKACKPLPVYARVDVVLDANNELALGEVELIEPELWFRKNDAAADRLADGVLHFLSTIN